MLAVLDVVQVRDGADRAAGLIGVVMKTQEREAWVEFRRLGAPAVWTWWFPFGDLRKVGQL